jgi:hypothetical protein
VSKGTPWRAEGSRAAAAASDFELFIPEQPRWSDSFVNAFELFRNIDTYGGALAWLAHIDVLKLVIMKRSRSALVLEDDVDWSTNVREETGKVAKAVLELAGQQAGVNARYRLDWGIIWMGHCVDPTDFKHKPSVT